MTAINVLKRVFNVPGWSISAWFVFIIIAIIGVTIYLAVDYTEAILEPRNWDYALIVGICITWVLSELVNYSQSNISGMFSGWAVSARISAKTVVVVTRILFAIAMMNILVLNFGKRTMDCMDGSGGDCVSEKVFLGIIGALFLIGFWLVAGREQTYEKA